MDTRVRPSTSAASATRFDPAQGKVRSWSAQWNRQSAAALRGRLITLCLLLAGLEAITVLQAILVGFERAHLSQHLLVFAALGVALAWLIRSSDPTHAGLVVTAAAVMAVPAISLALGSFSRLHALLSVALSGALLEATTQWVIVMFVVAILTIVVGVLLPLGVWQTLAVSAPLNVVPIAIALALSSQASGVRPQLVELFDADLVTGSFAIAAIGIVVAVVCAHTIYGLRRSVAEAAQLGQYRLIEMLGKGGMGEVWRAEHTLLARPAAVKLVRAELLSGQMSASGSDAVPRFEQEARVTSSLRSPNTIELYDFGVSDEDTLYYVMELLDGFDLEALVTEHGQLPPERVCHLLIQACRSLSEAHEAGLVHRDIKPSNIYVCRLGSSYDVVKVLDFGLVKVAPGPAMGPTITQEHTILGTPAYLAPEMALGAAADARSDIYALGGVAFWMLTGRFVFPREDLVSMITAHVSESPVAPSTLTETDVPAALDAIVLRCLAKEPEARFASADELATALGKIEVGAPWDYGRRREWWGLRVPSSTP